jgi:YVTN family beta-propeller protein
MHMTPQRAITGSLAMLTTLAVACDRAPSPPPPTSQAAPAPAAAPAAPSGPRVYVSDETGSRVVVIDPATRQVVRTIEVGKRPRGISASHDGRLMYVALSGSPIAGPGVDESKLPPADRAADGIGVIDLASGTLVRKYQSGQDPEAFALSKDGKMMFISNEETAELTALELDSGTIKARVKIGEEPEGVTTRPDGQVVYVTCEGTNEVVGIDVAGLKVVAHIKTGPRPRSIAFDRAGRTGFVTAENNATLTVFDTASHKVTKTIQIPKGATSPTPARPMGQVLSPDGARLFVSLGRAKSVAIVDVASATLAGSIEDVGTRPWGIGISPDGRQVYTANGPSGDVSVIDTASGKVDARIAVGGSPWGIAVTAR